LGRRLLPTRVAGPMLPPHSTQEPACCSEREREKVKKQRKFAACCRRERGGRREREEMLLPEEMMVPREGSCWPPKIMCVGCRMHMENCSEGEREKVKKQRKFPACCRRGGGGRGRGRERTLPVCYGQRERRNATA
jgi:hypothetical protein